MSNVLTLAGSDANPLSIRAKAMVFHDPRSVGMLAQIDRLAASNATILVIGETGTGKEVLVRHIHALSGRAGPFVAVNCGALSETLIESELFGHEAGSFTGASQARAGWFEAANHGTLFLDEIGDLPLAMQVKLLRVLQEGQVTRLGSRRPITLDIRLVAATNVDLARAVQAQHFRADLYYRLNVATLNLPPLRDRPGDIIPLAQHFLAQYSTRLHIEDVTFSREAKQALLSYSWPGNIRELENVIHHALIVCKGGQIRHGDIRLVPLVSSQRAAHRETPRVPIEHHLPPDHIADHVDDRTWYELSSAFEGLLRSRPHDLFEQVQAQLVQIAYERTGHNQVHAARVLGITRNVLRTQLRRHGLLPGDDGLDDATWATTH